LVGSPAPDFTLNDLDGNPVSLRDLRGQVVFLNFWATWCPPCRAEMPEIESIHQKYKDKGVTVIGIDIRETVAEVRNYTEAGGYSWTFVIDRTGAVAADYAVSAIPASFFIDANGIIRAIHVGALTRGGMESRLAAAMEP
jgi:DsbE subfamily thiol:disulfide oxidoreductase